MVTGFEDIATGLTLPDPKDCHVLAAAIECGAQVIVTYNLRDFPKDALAPHNIEARHADDFLLETLDISMKERSWRRLQQWQAAVEIRRGVRLKLVTYSGNLYHRRQPELYLRWTGELALTKVVQ